MGYFAGAKVSHLVGSHGVLMAVVGDDARGTPSPAKAIAPPEERRNSRALLLLRDYSAHRSIE